MQCLKCNNIINDDCNFCPYCGTKIEREETSFYQKDFYKTAAYTYNQVMPKKKKSSAVVKAGIIVVAIIVGIIVLGLILDEPEPEIPSVSEPISGEVLVGAEDENGSELTISAADSESCVVKLKSEEGYTKFSFYVRAGDTVTMNVPARLFYVYFASGDTWYGEKELFGESTSYSMDDEIKDFETYTYKYTLYPVTNGNFSETPIDASEF